MTGEGGLPNEESNHESRSNSCGFPGRCPGREKVLVVVKAAGVGLWHRLVRD
jgi:hypothetical protein